MKFDFSRLRVDSADPTESQSVYDIGFFCVGYERRARFIPESFLSRTVRLCGLKYQNTSRLAFAENLEWASQNRAELIEAEDYQVDRSRFLRNKIIDVLSNCRQSGPKTRIWIDVSAMDRSLLARVLHTVLEYLKPPFELRIFYAPARFVEPSYAFTPIKDSMPAIPELAGALGPPGREISLLIGLGYEYGVALGLIQRIEPDTVLAFVPRSHEVRYDEAVSKANFKFDFGIDNPSLVRYPVDQPVSAFDKLFAITSNASQMRSVIIVPNGPKIFAAISILIGIIRRPHVTILRTSQTIEPPSHHVEADGRIISFVITGN